MTLNRKYKLNLGIRSDSARVIDAKCSLSAQAQRAYHEGQQLERGQKCERLLAKA